MKLSLITTLLLSGALATPAQTIVADIKALRSLTLQLNSLLQTVHQGPNAIQELLAINNIETQILVKTHTSTDDIQHSPPLNKHGSSTVATHILTFTGNVIATLKSLVADKPFFDDPNGDCSLDVSNIVLANLRQQQQEADQFGAALIAILTPAFQKAAPAVQRQLDDAFQQAIAAFEQPRNCSPS